ncbi:hypothetical protein ACQ4PT_038646 [Festuca glaucescens]
MLAAEGEVDAMLTAEEGDGEVDAMLTTGKREVVCRFRDCICRWLYFSLTTRVAPGIDYVDIPDADRRPAWSLLVGVTDGASSLRLSRLRVARSGRILGRSDDALDVFHNMALQLTLQPQADDDTKELPLPEIDETCACIPIYADGHIWALSATLLDDDIDSFRVVTRRLVDGTRWEHVGAPFTGSVIHYKLPPWSGYFLQGYAVLPDADQILVSFQNYGLFLTFHTKSGRWSPVLTDTEEPRLQDYLPIHGRGIYVQRHQAVYMQRDDTIYAYKLTYHERAQGTPLLKLDPPVEIDFICPFIPEKGYGILTRLTDRLMCSVWISLAWRKPACPCHYLHAIVTTFHLRDEFQGGIKVLHSTYRRVDMVPNPRADQKFCFLQ